jgi:hypothetical protein
VSETMPKKPAKDVEAILRLTGPDGKHHYIWGDSYAAHCLNDALGKLSALEAEVARLKGQTQ